MATNPIDPIEEEIKGILEEHPELHERFDRLEHELAAGTTHVHSHEDVARMLGFEDELD